MKKSPIKEFIITSIAAAVAGFVVKKGYQYFKEAESTPNKNKEKDLALPAAATEVMQDSSEKIGRALKQSNPAEKGLVATLAYTMTAFMVSKMLRKVI